MTAVLNPRAAPLRSRPAAVPIDVRSLGVVDVGEGHNGILVLVERNLPHPVADAVGAVDDGERIVVGIGVRLVDVEYAVGNLLEFGALDVAEDGTVAVVDVNHVEINPVGVFIVGMTGRVGQVDFVLAVALVLGIGTCAGRLDNLLRTKVEGAVVIGVGHSQASDGRVPVDAAPAEVPVCGVVTEDER